MSRNLLTADNCILLVDDNPTNLQLLYSTLKGRGYRLLLARSGESAIETALKTQPHLILLDILMPDGIDGYETCKRLKADDNTKNAAVIFLSALGETGDKVRGLDLGAVDYIQKPFQAEEVLARVKNHLTINRLQRELQARNSELSHELCVAQELLRDANERTSAALLGASDAVEMLRRAIELHAQSDAPLLLVGPLGAGDEAVARALHHTSDRSGRAFIYTSCALLEDPKALGQKLELAQNGTLYLDGVELLSDGAQELLIGHLSRNGSNVRLVGFLSEGHALPKRLKVLWDEAQIMLPPLAKRIEDIPTLVLHFTQKLSRRLKRRLEVEPQTLERLQGFVWAGNVRELRNVIEREAVRAKDGVLRLEQAFEDSRYVGNYRLSQKLGEGGMGEVWLAHHQLLARPAAIKLIHAKKLGQTNREVTLRNFRREAQATANLDSPHTVKLYDFGVADTGEFYYAMELLKGMNLESIVRRHGPLSPGRVVHVMMHVCRSLSEAHGAGLVHRDIKPANLFACVLGSSFDVIKVLDFGLVTGTVGELAEEERSQFLVGTPAFMSPEQWRPNATIDAKTDLYGLGCVAYWLLTGQSVFSATKPIDAMKAHLAQKPTPPSAATSQAIPPELDALILHCLAKKTDLRPQSAKALERHLMRVPLKTPWTQESAEVWWTVHAPTAEPKLSQFSTTRAISLESSRDRQWKHT